MNDSNESKDRFYALLIGIDRYEPNPDYTDLRGCVRDIDLVDAYIRQALNVPQQHIWKLTSPLEETQQISAIRSTRQELKPTYANIVKAFQEITAKAQSREQVYIHYSGHGGRAKTIYPELEGEQRHDEGIVPMDIGNLDGRYLRDVEIATLLKRLTDKDCLVTVIFDSCHSGGATRNDYAIRGNPKNQIDLTDRNSDSLVASRQELIANWKTLTQADPELANGWLPNANDYVFLAACRPSEFAHEYAINGRQRNGALTYWLVDTLTSSTSVLTYRSLYNRVQSKIQSKFPQQLPLLMGDGDREVFSSRKTEGDRCYYKPYAVNIMEVDDEKGEIILNAGLAQGLSTGTRFAVYPIEVRDFSDRSKQIAIVELTENILADRSTAQILHPAAGGLESKTKIEPGASAVMVAAPIDLIRKVRLVRKEVGEREQDLPADLAVKQIAALEKVRQALVGNGWLVEVKGEEESHFQVAVSPTGTYEICVGMPIKNISGLGINHPDSPQKVVNRLVHLIKYQTVRELDNPASNLTEYLEFQICDRQKQPLPDPQNVALKPEETVYLRIKNNYFQPLNVAVLDLEPTWEISQIPLQGSISSFFPLDSGQETHTMLQFRVPDGYETEREILKIFATKGLANFQWLTLPALDKKWRNRGNSLNQELTTRSRGQTINPLNHILTAIGSDLDNPPEKTRAMVYKPDPNAEWATQQIQITVTK